MLCFTHHFYISPLRGFGYVASGYDGLRPSLLYFTASRLLDLGILFTMGLDN